ncbi:MAG: hypothetical protein L3J21_03965 [Devosiaceae bacterium]|nr:hypothetical protein [Devosiaceae bacterium]
MNLMKTEYFTGVRLNSFFTSSRVNNFFAGLRTNISYIGIAGIAGLVLLGGGYTWVSNLSGPNGYVADSILNLDVILAMDVGDNGQVFGPQFLSDSQADQAAMDLRAVEQAATDKNIEFRLPVGLPTPVENLPLLIDSKLYSAANQQQVSPARVSSAQTYWELENETSRLKPSYVIGTEPVEASELVIASTTDQVAPIPAVLTPEARATQQATIQQRTNAGAGQSSQRKTIEQVLADPIRSANDLLKSWQQLRAQTAHEFSKLPWN